MRRNFAFRVVCVLMAAILVLIGCCAGHDCHGAMDEHCPVCGILSIWESALPALAAVCIAVLAGILAHLTARATAAACENATLVALKVKLSD